MVDTPHPDKQSAGRRPAPWVIVLSFAVLVGFITLFALQMKRVQSGPVTMDSEVPPFTVTSFDGQTFNTASLKGKVVLINFWASWCTTCKDEAVALEQAYQEYKPGGQVVFLGLDYVDTEPEALDYLKTWGVTYPNGPDLRTKISQMFRITGVPETYILDQAGRLRYAKKGPFASLAEIEAAIDPLLGE